MFKIEQNVLGKSARLALSDAVCPRTFPQMAPAGLLSAGAVSVFTAAKSDAALLHGDDLLGLAVPALVDDEIVAHQHRWLDPFDIHDARRVALRAMMNPYRYVVFGSLVAGGLAHD